MFTNSHISSLIKTFGFLCLAATPAIAQEAYFITHKPSGMLISSCELSNGSPVFTAPASLVTVCSQWEKPSVGEYFLIKNHATGRVIRPESAENGANIVVQPGEWQGNWAQWRFEHRDKGFGHLVNRATGKFIFLGFESVTLQQQPSSWRGEYTQWLFKPVVRNSTQDYLFEAEDTNLVGSASVVSTLAASQDKSVTYINSLGAGLELTNDSSKFGSLVLRYAAEQAGKISVVIDGVEADDIPFESTLTCSSDNKCVLDYVDLVTQAYIERNSSLNLTFNEGDAALTLDALDILELLPHGDLELNIFGASGLVTLAVFDAQGKQIARFSRRQVKGDYISIDADTTAVSPFEWRIIDEPEGDDCEIISTDGIVVIECNGFGDPTPTPLPIS